MKFTLTFGAVIFFSLWATPILAQQNAFIRDYLERLESSREYLILVAESMPEERYDFKATPEEMSFAEHLLHIGFAMNWHGQTLIGGVETPNWQEDIIYKTAGRSKADMIEVIKKTFDNTMETIGKLDESQLDDQLEYFGLSRSKRQIFLMLTDHITHHRGQMLVYLRLNGLVPPRYVLFQ